jgi:ABC-type spermidine/putrescine transport system permease subunit II
MVSVITMVSNISIISIFTMVNMLSMVIMVIVCHSHITGPFICKVATINCRKLKGINLEQAPMA